MKLKDILEGDVVDFASRKADIMKKKEDEAAMHYPPGEEERQYKQQARKERQELIAQMNAEYDQMMGQLRDKVNVNGSQFARLNHMKQYRKAYQDLYNKYGNLTDEILAFEDNFHMIDSAIADALNDM